jgi:glycerol-3-phosphate acyltransferase PlsY
MGMILSAIGAYLIGSAPFGLLVERLLSERSFKHIAAILADILKGFIAVALLTPVGPWSQALTATAVVAGHQWSILGGERGNTGLAVAAGAISVISPIAIPVWAFLWALTFVISGYQPVASATATVFFAPLLGWIAGWPLGLMSLPVCAMILDRLRPALRRVLLGTEPRHIWRAGS